MTTLGHFHESEIHENLNAGVKNPKQLVNPAESWLFLCTDTEVNQNNHVFSTGLSVLRSLSANATTAAAALRFGWPRAQGNFPKWKSVRWYSQLMKNLDFW